MTTTRPITRRGALVGIAGALATAGCGFRPLYGGAAGPQGGPGADLSAIAVRPIADRRGQVLRNQLETELTPRGVPGDPRYYLDVTLAELVTDLDLQRTATATYANLRMSAGYRLVEVATGKKVTGGRSDFTVSYNILTSPYSNLAAEDDARRRALDEIARDIRRRLALFFVAQG